MGQHDNNGRRLFLWISSKKLETISLNNNANRKESIRTHSDKLQFTMVNLVDVVHETIWMLSNSDSRIHNESDNIIPT